jgi:hypothetical protein
MTTQNEKALIKNFSNPAQEFADCEDTQSIRIEKLEKRITELEEKVAKLEINIKNEYDEKINLIGWIIQCSPGGILIDKKWTLLDYIWIREEDSSRTNSLSIRIKVLQKDDNKFIDFDTVKHKFFMFIHKKEKDNQSQYQFFAPGQIMVNVVNFANPRSIEFTFISLYNEKDITISQLPNEIPLESVVIPAEKPAEIIYLSDDRNPR